MNIRTRDAVDAIEELKRRSRRLARCLNGTAQRVGRAALRVGLEIADRADRLEPTGAISVLISQTERVAHRHAATLTSVPSGAAGALRFLFAREMSWISSILSLRKDRRDVVDLVDVCARRGGGSCRHPVPVVAARSRTGSPEPQSRPGPGLEPDLLMSKKLFVWGVVCPLSRPGPGLGPDRQSRPAPLPEESGLVYAQRSVRPS